jgi:hypothetical protein
MKKQFVLLILMTFFLVACNNPKDTVIPIDIDSWESNPEFKEKIQELESEDQMIFAAFTMRAALSDAFGGNSIKEGTTIGQAIEAQKVYNEELKKKFELKKASEESKVKEENSEEKKNTYSTESK